MSKGAEQCDSQVVDYTTTSLAEHYTNMEEAAR